MAASGPNRSSAVMQQRNEPPDSLDFFPTPPWATRALCEWLQAKYDLSTLTAEDPAAGHGDMARPLHEYFKRVTASDVHDYSAWNPDQHRVEDFLLRSMIPRVEATPDWIITNPPFNLAVEFVVMAHQVAQRGCAMLLRTAFLEGQERGEGLFSTTPPTDVLHFSERVIMAKGRLRDPAVPYWDAEKKVLKKPTTATAYSWFVWRFEAHKEEPTYRGDWLRRCRQRLEREGDYPPLPQSEIYPGGRGCLL